MTTEKTRTLIVLRSCNDLNPMLVVRSEMEVTEGEIMDTAPGAGMAEKEEGTGYKARYTYMS